MAYAEITESDLNYTNLERVRLIGANLKDADLSYADISNALFTGANMSNTKFDNAIWIDGQVCKKINRVLPNRTTRSGVIFSSITPCFIRRFSVFYPGFSF